jgi:dTDP-4-amino-4,6-dideoxygalactose transaminase
MLNTSLSPWPNFSAAEVDAVSSVLASNRVNYWTGTECRSFETEFADWAGCRHAIALANGTLALDLALHGLGIGSANGGSPSDEVVVTPRTFLASVSCVVNAGAIPVFADVDIESGNLTASAIAEVMTSATRAIIPVHLAGWPCDMDPIMELARKHDVGVVEDCAQAHGARYKGRSVGSIGDVGAWSFCQDKIMTTGGEGGMVTCQNRELWARMWAFKDHGKSWEAVYGRQHPAGFRWIHESFGTNWRMLEMQGAIGRIQLKRMPEWVRIRTAHARKLLAMLGQFPDLVRVPGPPEHIDHAYYRLYAYVKESGLKTRWSRDNIIAKLTEMGAPAFQGSCSEVYLEKAFDGTGFRPPARLPNARSLGKSSLAFLTHPSITEPEMDEYCSKISEVLRSATI